MRAALADGRWLAILGSSLALGLVLLATPLAGRTWMVIAWGVVVYLFAVGVTMAAPRSHQVRPELPDKSAPDARDVPDVPQGDALIRPTEEALRRLNKPGALADCALIGFLPLSLKELAAHEGDGLASPNQLLRAAIVQAIERLVPGEGSSEPHLYRAIVTDEYVRGHSTARIMTRYSISESTFHRHRRDAIRAIARDLIAREKALAAGNAYPREPGSVS